MKVIDILDRIANGEKLHFCVINEGFKTEYFKESYEVLGINIKTCQTKIGDFI